MYDVAMIAAPPAGANMLHAFGPAGPIHKYVIMATDKPIDAAEAAEAQAAAEEVAATVEAILFASCVFLMDRFAGRGVRCETGKGQEDEGAEHSSGGGVGAAGCGGGAG